ITISLATELTGTATAFFEVVTFDIDADSSSNFKRLKNTKLEIRRGKISPKNLLQTRIQSHGRRGDVKAESKEVRRFLTIAMEATNSWPRIRLLRRKNLTSAERAGEGPKLHHSVPENRHHD
ncbi:hypothetical protein Celaphus_00012923, partial [Cervus elaphus hippelaphus]